MLCLVASIGKLVQLAGFGPWYTEAESGEGEFTHCLTESFLGTPQDSILGQNKLL